MFWFTVVFACRSAMWLDPNGGIGASADSFYEYLLKAYVLFGEQEMPQSAHFGHLL
jgi:hypothetical protein